MSTGSRVRQAVTGERQRGEVPEHLQGTDVCLVKWALGQGTGEKSDVWDEQREAWLKEWERDDAIVVDQAVLTLDTPARGPNWSFMRGHYFADGVPTSEKARRRRMRAASYRLRYLQLLEELRAKLLACDRRRVRALARWGL